MSIVTFSKGFIVLCDRCYFSHDCGRGMTKRLYELRSCDLVGFMKGAGAAM